jgi:predicted nucleic acid-binding Zn ribbon protein
MNYCSNCGNNIDDGDLFCSSCGVSLNNEATNKDKKRESFSYKFSSNILLGGNILTPDKMVINENGVTYIKRNKYLIGKDRVYLSFENISSVRIDRKLIDADIIISSRGTVEIEAKDFSISAAKKIEKLIQEFL